MAYAWENDEISALQVTFILGSVRAAIGTNMCLQQAERSVPDGDSGLAIELELGTQDAQLLVDELKGCQQKATRYTRSPKAGHNSCDADEKVFTLRKPELVYTDLNGTGTQAGSWCRIRLKKAANRSRSRQSASAPLPGVLCTVENWS